MTTARQTPLTTWAASHLPGIGATVLLLSLATACGAGDTADETTVPTVLSHTPDSDAPDVPINETVSATFSVPMDPATLTAETFTLTVGDRADPVEGTVSYADTTAVFLPAEYLVADSIFTVTVKTTSLTTAGIGLAADYVWSFTSGNAVIQAGTVKLGKAADFVILTKSGLSTLPTSDITGDIGISPAPATSITGFELVADATNLFSTSTQIVGRVYSADNAAPTPSNLTTAVSDMQRAYSDAASRIPDYTEWGAGALGYSTLSPGVYHWSTGVEALTDVTLVGSDTDVWIFQIAGDLIMNDSTHVYWIGGALPKNVFWQVAGRVELGARAQCVGTIMTKTSITLGDRASVNGRLLSQTEVNMNRSTVELPAQ